MKLFKGGGRAFFGIFCIFVLILISSKASIADDSTVVPQETDPNLISTPEPVSEPAVFASITSDKKTETSQGEVSSDESVQSVQAAATSSYQDLPGSNDAGGKSIALSALTVDTFQFTGAAAGKIPIFVPPGRLGIQPNLALIYNSYLKNGWVGVGWDLDLVAIQRSTRHGVDYGGNDFVVLINGSSSELVERHEWGSDYYGAKIESRFTKYQYKGDAGWEVTGKDGTRYFYGTSSASRQVDPDDSSRVFKWCLDRVEDSNGNFMTVAYTKELSQIYPDQIDYTGNGNLAPANTVKFYLAGRPDVVDRYTARFKVTTAKILEAIEVHANGQLAGRYQLTYKDQNPSTSRSLLHAVTQYGSDGQTSQPQTEFTYTTKEAGFENLGSNWIESGYKNFADDPGLIRPMDVNADGRQDIVIGPSGSGKWFVLRSAENQMINDGAWIEGAYKNWKDNPDRIRAMDVNADGMMDIVIGPNKSGKWFVLRSTGTDFVDDGAWIAGAYGGWHDNANRIRPVDVNADGMTDIVIGPNKYGDWFVLRSTGTQFVDDGVWLTGAYGGWHDNADRIRPMDVNADGMVDIVIGPNKSGNWYVLRSTGTDFVDDGAWITGAYGNWYDNAAKIRPMDANGDGFADLVIGPSGSGNWYVLLSTGDSFSDEGAWMTNSFGGWKNYRIRSADVNGDGMQDIVLGPNGSGEWYILMSTGSSFINKTEWKLKGLYDSWRKKEKAAHVRPMDVNGDGMHDIVIGPNNSGNWFVLMAGGSYPDLLAQVDNGAGGSTAIDYLPSSHYANDFLPFVLHPVSEITVNDGLDNLAGTAFSYTGGRYDIESREFRGFHTAVQTSAPGTPHETVTLTQFHQDEYLKGRPSQVEFKEPGETGALLSKTAFSWFVESYVATNLPYAAHCFVYLQQKIAESYDGATTTRQEIYQYNSANGNLLSKTISGTDGETLTSTYQYSNFGNWTWRPTQETIEGSSSGKVREAHYGYESDTGNLLYKVFWLSDGDNPRLEMTYDPYGNQQTVKDARGNITATEYDTITYTFPVKIIYPETNGISHIVENEAWDYRFGKVITTRDENGNPTEYAYDEFGRLVQVDFPNGGQVTTEYVDTEFPRYVVTKVKEDPSGSTIDTYQYVDGLGREIQTISFGEAGKSIVTKKFYDALGRNDLAEGPFFAAGVDYPLSPSDAYPWQQITFDLRGRPEAVESADGEYGSVVTTFDYNGLSATVTDPDGSRKTERKDYLGRVVEVVEHADQQDYVTRYAYNAAGDLLTVNDHYSNTTTIDYDTLGRKISMNDPDMGYWEYTYDSNGNLITQIDEKLQTISFNYDVLNRIISKTYSTNDPTVTYTYDNLDIAHGRGRLYAASNAHATTIYNAYDEIGNIKSFSKTIAGDAATYTTQYTYDLSGKLINTAYPDGYQLTNTYHPKSGLLEAVRDPQSSLLAYMSNYTPTGKIGRIDYRNTVTTEYAYDPESTRLMSIVTQGPQVVGNQSASASIGVGSASQSASMTGIGVPAPTPEPYYQNKTYAYTPAGNIKEMTNHIEGVSFYCTYDKLHRLKSETNTGAYDPISYTYGATGNLTAKTIGNRSFDYTYDTWHKHAVKTIDVNGFDFQYEYDDNGNMISGPDFSDPAQVATRSISYNADNMVTRIVHAKGGSQVTTDFTYDGDGVRAKKVIGGGSTTYYIGAHFEIKNGVATKYIFAGNLRVAMIKGAETSYFHKDHLGSSTVMTDAAGEMVESSSYMPFGALRSHSGTEVSDYKYTDQEFDPESGLYNYNARLYDPVIGRFISADPFVQAPFDPQTLNRYSYCRNNPLIYIDPSGYGFFGDLWDSIQDIGDSIWDAIQPYAGPIVYTAVYVGLTFTPLDPITANMIAGAAAGAVTGADKGGLEGAIAGAFTGGALGAFAGAFAGMDQMPGLVRAGLSFGLGAMQDQMTGKMGDGGGDNKNGSSSRVYNGPTYFDNVGSNYAREPDFVTGTFSFSPLKYIPVFSWSISGTLDRYGNWYWSIIGPGFGRAPKAVSGALTANWIIQPSNGVMPKEHELSNFLSGHGITGAAGNWAGGNIIYSFGNGYAAGFGIVSPQLGGNYSYTLKGPGKFDLSW